jgi:hypothetical protein|tara:strand:+ start:20628 stop:21443 length:816 start_codon:yes stop_codon:yes gene_type:complete
LSHVFIIGNGFDLNLGLKTSYKDFIRSSFFTRNLGENGLSLFNHLNEVNQSNWIDIEKELAIYSTQGNGGQKFLNEYEKLCEELKSYIKEIKLKDVEHESYAYKILEEIDWRDDFIILNFNYTNSVSFILSMLDVPAQVIKDSVIHVHGSAISDEIIFGVDDGASIHDDHSFLRKSTSSIYSGRLVRKALKNFKTLSIFGHSLGESDHMYLNFFSDLTLNFMGENSDKTINLYHYGKEAKYLLFKQLHVLTQRETGALKDNVEFNQIDVSK